MPLSYAELCTWTNASFLRGASSPEDMVTTAHALGYTAVAITDWNDMGGMVRAHTAAQQCGIKLLVGAQLQTLEPSLPPVILLARNRRGYGQICRLLTEAKRHKPQPAIAFARLLQHATQCVGLLLGTAPEHEARAFAHAFGSHGALAITRLFGPGEEQALRTRQALAQTVGLPLVATGQPRCHVPSQKALLDVLTAIRLGRTVAECGFELTPNAECALQPIPRYANRFHRLGLIPAFERTLHLAEACTFSMDELQFVYPKRHLPPGESPASYFRALVQAHAAERYKDELTGAVRAQLEHELRLILQLRVEGFFLTMHDIIQFARSRGILCQGRGSAANSVVCYALGITAVEPVSRGLLFERFLSAERNEPPDIDVDFEHERREEVIQYVYRHYGREHAGLVCENIRYRPRSAIRDVGKALGLPADALDRVAKGVGRRHWEEVLSPDFLRHVQLSDDATTVTQWHTLIGQILGFPRHRGTHVGGMVVTHDPLVESAPVEDAAMPGRTILPWDKDDCSALGICKFDLLGLGILTAIRKSFSLIEQHGGPAYALHTIPADDAPTFAQVARADTVGVFQLESRAQMSTLPRLRPARFYDLAVAISLIRPGPIQGGMVHPYLRRRNGEEPVTYAHPDLEPILARTLGVPLFQEQVMRIAITSAGFTPGEADELRRAMGAWRRTGSMKKVQDRLIQGMTARGIERAYAQQIYRQIEGFGEYGFPESHAISFALLAYVSAYLKTHHPAAFAAALLNSQPMGFYAPHTLLEDAKRHGVTLQPIDVTHSHWDCTLEEGALRLGLRLVHGLGPAAKASFEQARAGKSFVSIDDFSKRTGLDRRALGTLARAGAFQSLSPAGTLGRRDAFWEVLRPGDDANHPAFPLNDDPTTTLAPYTLREAVHADYQTTGVSPQAHPVAFLRPHLAQQRVQPVAQLAARPDAQWVWVGGLVIARQHPQTAKGFVFLSLEDETGILNVIVNPTLFAEHRLVITKSPFLLVGGELQNRQGTQSLRAVTLHALNESTTLRSRDFR